MSKICSISKSASLQLRGNSSCAARFFDQLRNFTANRAVVTKVKRTTYCRKYPTLLVQPDGSTFTIKYHEPREIIKLPVKFDECTPEQQKQIRLMRLPKGASKTKEEFVATFDPLKYL
jgi:large subunit ribosomal protein L55